MTLRLRTVLASIAVLVLAACQGGGGGSNPVPPSTENGAPITMGNASAEFAAVPQTAPNGVRAYIHLPLRNVGQLEKLVEQQSTPNAPLYHHWLTPQQFRDSYGPTISDLRAAAAALQSYGFKTTITTQGIFADAPQATVERTFGIHLRSHTESVRQQQMSSLVADRAPILPAALSKLSAQVAAFSSVPAHRVFSRRIALKATPENRYSPVGPYWFDDLKQAYEYPAYQVARGQGKTIAIVMASDFLDSDMAAYFGHEHLAVPHIVRRPVGGGAPPFDPNSGVSAEVTIDVQESGGSAPGATIMVYLIPDLFDSSDIAGFVAVDEDNLADVVSYSAGQCELDYTAAYNLGIDMTGILQVYHQVFLQGNSQGITFMNSSGDSGALGCPNSFPFPTGVIAGVSSPASDPNITGVGGTNLITSFIPGSLRSTYVSENAFFDRWAPGQGGGEIVPGPLPGQIWASGGGKSVIFGKPSYQLLVDTHASTRAVPDVSLQMGGCPIGTATPASVCEKSRSAGVFVFGGQLAGFIGTSLSSPEFAGLQAIQDEVLGSRAGNVNFLLYSLARAESTGNGPIFHNDIPGNNGYPSTRGYNFVVGNGTVRGSQYAFRPFGPFAGDPQTPSNP